MPEHIRRTIPTIRSVPFKRPFVSALFASYLHYLSLVTIVAALCLVLARRDIFSSRVLAGSVTFVGFTWLMSFFKRRNARCPLCKGTPFLDSGALVSSKAVRFYPLNHGTTAVLSCLFGQRFRCMYCGTRFDLLKTPGSQQPQHTYYEDHDES